MNEFAELVDAHYQALFRFGVSLTRDADRAADLVQETFCIWAAKGDQLRDRSKAKTWLFTTLHREFLGQRRRAERFPEQELDEKTAAAISAPEDDAERQMDAQHAVELLGALDEAYRAPMSAELAELVRTYSTEQQYSLVGDVEIAFDADPELDTGIFRVRSEAKASVTAVPERAASSPAAMAPVNAPPPMAPSPSTWSKPVIASPARLVIRDTAYPLTRATTVLGRGSDVDIRIDDPGVSRRHVEISTAPAPFVRDLGSTNGTLLNGQRVSEAALVDGDVLQIGSTELHFRSG